MPLFRNEYRISCVWCTATETEVPALTAALIISPVHALVVRTMRASPASLCTTSYQIPVSDIENVQAWCSDREERCCTLQSVRTALLLDHHIDHVAVLHVHL